MTHHIYKDSNLAEDLTRERAQLHWKLNHATRLLPNVTAGFPLAHSYLRFFGTTSRNLCFGTPLLIKGLDVPALPFISSAMVALSSESTSDNVSKSVGSG